jgi:hypothetical protein
MFIPDLIIYKKWKKTIFMYCVIFQQFFLNMNSVNVFIHIFFKSREVILIIISPMLY